jgi:hypothetical protein
MSLSAQKAWYKKNNMEMPASKPNEVAGKSAAAAKKVKVAPRTVAAIEPNSVRAINAARQKEYMAKGGRQPIGAAGSGGNSSMAGSNMSTAKGIVAGIKAGFNPKVSLDPYESERAKKVGPRSLKLKKESVDEALSPERKRMFDLKLKYIKKAANRKDRAKPSKVDTPRTALNPAADMKLNPKPMDTRTWDYIMKNEEAEQIEEGNPANKAKKKEAIRQLGLKAMAAGKVDKARGYIPQRAGREMLKKEEAEMNEVTKAEAEKVLGGPVKTKPKMPPGKQPAGYRYVRGLARKAMKAGMKKDEYDSPARKAMERELQYNPRYRTEEVEQIDEVDYEKYLKVSQEKRPVKIGAVMAARKAEKQGDPNPIRKLANTQKAQRFARNQLAKKAPPKPYTPNPNPYGYGEGRYMGDSVENNGDVLDEGKVAKALAVGAMTLASMGAKAHTDTTKSVAQLAKERPALAQRLKDIGATGQVPASDKRAAELQRKQDQEMPASERRAKELEKMKKEETEESTMKYIEEKLTASDPASKWISDFVKSDNPKFAGKSKKERIQQALGAYYAKKRGTNEEVELDESHGAEKLGDMLESDADHETKMKRIKIAPTAHLKYLHKYNMGYSGGGDHPMIKHIKDELKNRKMKNEETEQIDEAIRGYITHKPAGLKGLRTADRSVEIRRPADQAERDTLAKNLAANRKYNLGKIGRKSGHVRKNAAGTTYGQKTSIAVGSPAGSKELGPKKFRYAEEVEQTDEAIRGYIRKGGDNAYLGVQVRRPANQAERDKLAQDIAANRKYNAGKNIGRKSGNVRANAAGMTQSQKNAVTAFSTASNKELGPKRYSYESVEGKVAVTPKEKSLAAHHGDKTKITYGDVIKARLKSAAAKKMGK